MAEKALPFVLLLLLILLPGVVFVRRQSIKEDKIFHPAIYPQVLEEQCCCNLCGVNDNLSCCHMEQKD